MVLDYGYIRGNNCHGWVCDSGVIVEMSGFCSAHKHHEPGCRQCEMDDEPMKVADFKCPECGEVFEDIWYMDSTVINCPYCNGLMEKDDGLERED